VVLVVVLRLFSPRNELTLVDHVPVGALPLVLAHDGVDVVGHDVDQGGIVEAALGDPGGQLRVPHEGMAADLLAVLDGPVDVLVGAGEGELAAAGLGGVPLLGVLGRDGAELALDDGLLGGVAAQGQGGTNVLAAGSHHGRVEGLAIAEGDLVSGHRANGVDDGQRRTHPVGQATAAPLRARATEAEKRILKERWKMG